MPLLTRRKVQRPRRLRAASSGLLIVVALAASTVPALATPVISAANIPNSAFAPGGVDMATGELILVMRPDLVLAGPMPLTFERYYGSMLSTGGPPAHMGPNWRSNFDFNLSLTPSGAVVTTNEGQQIQFQPVPGGWNLVSPTDLPYRLDSTPTAWRFTDPRRQQVCLFDSGSLRLTAMADAHGNSLNLIYAGGNLTQVNDGSGRSLTFAYDPAGLLVGVNDGTRAVHFAYASGRLASCVDAAGGVTSYAYTGSPALQNLIQSVTEPLGNSPMTWSYDPLGRVVGTTDALLNSSSFAWDLPAGNRWTDPLGHSWNYTHDAQGRLTSVLDPAGGTTSFTYDPLGRLASSTRPLGDVTSIAYDAASGRPSTLTRGDGTVFDFGYAGHGILGATLYDVTHIGYPGGAVDSFGRDPFGNLTDWTDRGGFHWTATYNGRGEPLTRTNAAGGTTTLAYDPKGNLISSTDNAGHTTSYEYDVLNRVTKVTMGDGSNQQFLYDDLDQIITLTDQAGKVWSRTYDANGRLSTTTNPLIEHEGFRYDSRDRLTQTTDPLGGTRSFVYDPAGRLASSTDRTGIVTQYQYDVLGRPIHVNDPAGGSGTLTYDGNSRIPAVQDALGHTTTFLYDALDRVVHLADPAGAATDYAYDPMGRPISANGPLGHSRSMSYDARGLATSFHDATSETDFTRTPLGEIGQVNDPNHNPWPSSFDPDGRMLSSSDPLARTSSYAYDAAGRLTHAILPLGSADVGFDLAGRPTSLGFSDGTLLNFVWNDANRMTGGTGVALGYDAAGRVTSSNGLTVTRDAEGRVTGESYGPGKLVSYAYDARGLLASMTDWLGGTTTFAHDTTGALISLIRPNGTRASYQYDDAGRLADLLEVGAGPVHAQLAHIAITRDPLGQPISTSRSQPIVPGVWASQTTNFSYDAASQLNEGTFDARGRMTSQGGRTFQWDGASRLTSFTDVSGPAVTHTWDALGSPLTHTQAGVSEQYLWNYAMDVPTLDIVSQGGAPKRYYVHMPSGLLLYSIEAASGARTYFSFDERGNTEFLADEAGALQTTYAYSPLGDVIMAGMDSANPFTFAAAGGAIQLGGGIYGMGGGVYDTKSARMISGGATPLWFGPCPYPPEDLDLPVLNGPQFGPGLAIPSVIGYLSPFWFIHPSWPHEGGMGDGPQLDPVPNNIRTRSPFGFLNPGGPVEQRIFANYMHITSGGIGPQFGPMLATHRVIGTRSPFWFVNPGGPVEQRIFANYVHITSGGIGPQFGPMLATHSVIGTRSPFWFTNPGGPVMEPDPHPWRSASMATGSWWLVGPDPRSYTSIVDSVQDPQPVPWFADPGSFAADPTPTPWR